MANRPPASAHPPSQHETADLLPIECTPSAATEILGAVAFQPQTLSKAAGT